MCVVRIEVLRTLADIITSAIPELNGHVCTGIAPSGEIQGYPSLTLLPGPMRYEPFQALESATIGDPAQGVVVFNVGCHYGPLQMILAASSIGERWTIEQKIIDMFLSRPGGPGVIVVPVNSCPDLGQWVAAFELESDQWVDTNAFDRIYQSTITCNEIVPALTTRRDAYEIRQLVLGTDASLHPPTSDVELVLIASDGSISPYVPSP